jgi:hypothetical protein
MFSKLKQMVEKQFSFLYNQREQSKININKNYIQFKLDPNNSKGFGLLGESASSISDTEDITSNLAFDKYLGLLAYGTSSGHIKIISLNGYELEIYNYFGNIPIHFLLFVPGKFVLISIDS